MADTASSGQLGAGGADQLSEVLRLLDRARKLFGDNPIAPPDNIVPQTSAAGRWVV